ncbi:MAG: tetratricopeptide repeat protein [Planctomycetes bacterium]|nr:tetratricopeptide repeat protein [Planctomycetota bacterium]
MANHKKFGLAVALAVCGLIGTACSSTRTVKQGNEEFTILEAKYLEALSLADDGKHFEAIQAWKEVLADEPRWAMGHFNLGQIYDKLNLMPEAMEQYEQAAKLDGEQGIYHLNLGTVYLRSGLSKQALDALKKAAEKDPYNHLVHYNLAGTYLVLADHDNCLIHADIAVDLYSRPESKNESGLAEGVDRDMLAKLLARQAECHVARGEAEKARQCADRITRQCRVELPRRLADMLDSLPPAEKTEE